MKGNSMKAVQEVLKVIDEKELIDNYLATYPISIDDFDENITVGEVRKYSIDCLHQYLAHLKAMKIKSDDNQGIFFISRKIEDETGDTVTNLVFINDLKKYGVQSESYAFEFTPQPEIMGWLIADNILTQNHLNDLLVEILYESSFFGFKQEGLKKEIGELASSIKEIDNNLGKALSFDEFQKEFDFDKQDPKEEKLEVKVIQDKIEYSEYSRKKELAEIIEELSL